MASILGHLQRAWTLLLLLCIGLFSPSTSAAAAARMSLSLHLAPTAVLPQPQTLAPATTYARLTNTNATLTAPLRRSGRFVFTSVPPGSYLCDVWSHEYVFVPMRVDVTADAETGSIAVWQTFRGNEWGNTGEKLGEATRGGGGGGGEANKGGDEDVVSLEVVVGVLGQRNFYELRQGFNPMSLLKNPMILIGVVALVAMFGMPKLLENMDPEMREEFEKQQASSPLATLGGSMAGGGGGPSFDMAAWMAGTDKKEVAKSSGTEGSSSGGGGGGSKRRR